MGTLFYFLVKMRLPPLTNTHWSYQRDSPVTFYPQQTGTDPGPATKEKNGQNKIEAGVSKALDNASLLFLAIYTETKLS